MSQPLSLRQILDLCGSLNDSPGEDSSRERFHRFLQENVKGVGQIRDYVDECLRSSDSQFNRALQDLVNHTGRLLGFEVEFGRYQGVQGETGFDGLWKSPKGGYQLVVEVKTSETYAIKTTTLSHYIDDLVADKKITDPDQVLGLYVVGRPDPELKTFENAIVAQKRNNQRIISVDYLLSLAEMMSEYDVTHEDILSVLRPSGPNIDSIVDLVRRLVAQGEAEESEATTVEKQEKTAVRAQNDVSYWLTAVRGTEEKPAEEEVRRLLLQRKMYAFGDKTPGRKNLKVGDFICFYASGTGIVAHARVTSTPQRKPSLISEEYPWVFELEDASLFTDNPVAIDAARRSKLDAFQNRDINTNWAWFVQATHKITKHDFDLLTRG